MLGCVPMFSRTCVVLGRFLLVQEFADIGFWLPGGRVDPGESFQEAAIREAKEEAGVDVKLTGIMRVCSCFWRCVW